MAFANNSWQAPAQTQTQEFDGEKWLNEAIAKTARLNQVATIAQRSAEQAATGSLAHSVAMARFVGEIRSIVLSLLPTVKPLMGTQLGFRTDRDTGDKGPYHDNVIADCLTEAVIHGVHWTGNELNIIAGRMYKTKEFYTRAVRELAGLSDLQLNPGVPKILSGGAVVPYRATWFLNGTPHSIDRDIPVKMNNLMGADAVIGKATRKILAAIHSRVTGSTQSELDITEEIDTTSAVATPPAPAATTPAPQPGKVDLKRQPVSPPAAEAPQPEATPAPEQQPAANSGREVLLLSVDNACQTYDIVESGYLARYWTRQNGFMSRRPEKLADVSDADLAKLVAISDRELEPMGGEGKLFKEPAAAVDTSAQAN